MGELAQMERDEKSLAVRGSKPPATFTLTPKSLEEAMKLAELMSKSEIVPKDYQGKPANVLVAVQMGLEIGLAPMAALQNIAVINGRPGLFGDAGKALLLDRGFVIEERDADEIRELGAARCSITRPGASKPVVRTFSIADAEQAGLWNKQGPWKQYPQRMLAWRAFWWAARDAAADVLKGLGGGEELSDFDEGAPREPRNVTPPLSEAEIMPRRASEPKPEEPAVSEEPATEEPSEPRAIQFTLFKKDYVTKGFTSEQMKESFRLEAMVDKKAKGRTHDILRDEFSVESRNELDEENGEHFLNRLREECGA